MYLVATATGLIRIMATSDNISTKDWDLVHELALEIANACGEAEEQISRRRLLKYLDDLEMKYGALPSILATRADYVTDNNEKLQLLNQAFILAEATDDSQNLTEVAHSLAELYVEELGNLSESKKWLSRLATDLKRRPNKRLRKEYDRLSSLIAKLESKHEEGDSCS